MSSVPSIKGSVLATIVEDINKRIAGGELSREDAGRWLQPEDFALLDADILASGWYDIRAFTRMSELLLEVAGGGNTGYLRELGRQSARRLLEAGLYSQLDYLRRSELGDKTDERARFETFGKELRLLTTMARSIYNFSQWAVKADPERKHQYILEVTDATAFSDVLCWRIDGFINEMAVQGGQVDSALWAWKRLGPDRIVFHMLHPV